MLSCIDFVVSCVCSQQQMPFYQQPNMVAAWPPYYDPSYTPYMNGFPSQQGFNGTPSLLDVSSCFPPSSLALFCLLFSLPFLRTPLPPLPLPFSTHRSFSYPLCRVLLLSSFFPTLPRSYTQHNSDNNAHSKFMSNIKYSLPLIHSPLPPLLFSFWPYMVKIQP